MDEKEKKDIFARALEECNGIICDNIKLGKVMISHGYERFLYKMVSISYEYRYGEVRYENFISPRDLVLSKDMTIPIENYEFEGVVYIDGYNFSVVKLSNGHLIPTHSITVEEL